MNKSSLTKLVKTLAPDKEKFNKSLEDLQYNLTFFLNEDVYLANFNSTDKMAMFWIDYFRKNNFLYVTKKDKRMLLTPAGEKLLVEVNNLLLYAD